jgi:hypothetical protein
VDQLPQHAIVEAEGVGGVKTAKAAAAQRAAAFFIEREPVVKRGPAGYAEEFGVERGRPPEASGANGNAGNLVQRLAANAAIVGEEKGKKGARELLGIPADLNSRLRLAGYSRRPTSAKSIIIAELRRRGEIAEEVVARLVPEQRFDLPGTA